MAINFHFQRLLPTANSPASLNLLIPDLFPVMWLIAKAHYRHSSLLRLYFQLHLYSMTTRFFKESKTLKNFSLLFETHTLTFKK